MFLETVACAVSGEMDCAVSDILVVVPCSVVPLAPYPKKYKCICTM